MSEDTSKIPATRIIADSEPISGSNNPITSDGVAKALKNVAGQIAKRAEADAEGNEISTTYARISDVIFYEETN